MADSREWYYYEHNITGRKYTIRINYEDGDNKKQYTVSLNPLNPHKEEMLISSFVYDSEKHNYDPDEAAKEIARGHGNMNPRDELDLD